MEGGLRQAVLWVIRQYHGRSYHPNVEILRRRNSLVPRPSRRDLPILGLALACIGVATLVVVALEHAARIPDASAVYLVAVAIVGSVGGTWPAVATALGAFLIYDILFTEPRFSLVVADPTEWLNLVLVLIVAIAIGRLVALGRARADEAERRAREATDLFAVSRLLATAKATEDVALPIVERIGRETSLQRVWIALDGGSHGRILADTGSGTVPAPAVVTTLARTTGDAPARWVRAHDVSQRRGGATRQGSEGSVVRVKIEDGTTVFGSVSAMLRPGADLPDAEATRLLSMAADQLALAIRRDRLHDEATSAEVARRGDALKSALLDSVSHDLRTPLASIRAAAGNLGDPQMPWQPDTVRQAAETIDLEAQRLDRLVSSVLDLSRVESGALQPDLEVYDLRELIEVALTHRRRAPEERSIEIDVEDDLPLVRVDAVLLDAVLGNLLDNVARHTPNGAPFTIRAWRLQPGRVRLEVDDAGPGVAESDLPRLFEKFYRVGGPAEGSRRGMGIGLSVVRGMVEAMGGTAAARLGRLGGLTIELDLPTAAGPPTEILETLQ